MRFPGRRVRVGTGAALVLVTSCSGPEATATSPSSSSTDPNLAAVAESRIRSLTIEAPDTLFGGGPSVRLTASALDAAGNRVEAIVPRWSVSDTTLATISPAGDLRVRRTGALAVTASVAGVEHSVRVPVVAIDLGVAREVLADPYAERLLRGLEGASGDAARVAASQATAALAADDVPDLRRSVIRLGNALEAAAETPDRALVGVLDLFVDRLLRALALTTRED